MGPTDLSHTWPTSPRRVVGKSQNVISRVESFKKLCACHTFTDNKNTSRQRIE